MTATTTHTATVEVVPGRYPSYKATCPTCGQVGVTQAWRSDAERIASRHTRKGGYER